VFTFLERRGRKQHREHPLRVAFELPALTGGVAVAKLDLLRLGDGYTTGERGKFERDRKRLLAGPFATSPFKERENDINVWGVREHPLRVAFELPALAGGVAVAKLDLLVLGDGYTTGERGKFERDAKRMLAVLFATSPFKERENDINVWGLVPASTDSGISSP